MASARPRGREDVIEALLASAGRLIAERGTSVALREIADDAGVNFGLLYHYIGTKEQLIGEVYSRAAASAAERLVEAEDLEHALRLLMTLGDGTTARLVGWAALEGGRPAEVFRDAPALDVLADLLVAEMGEAGGSVSPEDARVFAALAMVLVLGWRLFAPTALFAAGLDGNEPEQYREQVQRYIDQLVAAAINPEGDPATRPRRLSRARGSGRSGRGRAQ